MALQRIDTEIVAVTSHTMVCQLLKFLNQKQIIVDEELEQLLSDAKKMNLQTPEGLSEVNREAAVLIGDVMISILSRELPPG